MRWFILLAALVAAMADAPLPPNVLAMQQKILQLTGESLEWQTKAIELQRENDELKKKVETDTRPH